MKQQNRTAAKKWKATPSAIMNSRHIDDLFRVYLDVEKTLKGLKKNWDNTVEGSPLQINVGKLIQQLSHSKKKIERKIGNTLLLEKQQLKRKLRELSDRL